MRFVLNQVRYNTKITHPFYRVDKPADIHLLLKLYLCISEKDRSEVITSSLSFSASNGIIFFLTFCEVNFNAFLYYTGPNSNIRETRLDIQYSFGVRKKCVIDKCGIY